MLGTYVRLSESNNAQGSEKNTRMRMSVFFSNAFKKNAKAILCSLRVRMNNVRAIQMRP